MTTMPDRRRKVEKKGRIWSFLQNIVDCEKVMPDITFDERLDWNMWRILEYSLIACFRSGV